MLIRSSVFGVQIFMCFRKQITARGDFVGVYETCRWTEEAACGRRAAAGPGLFRAAAPGALRAHPGGMVGLGKREHFPLSHGDGTGPLFLSGPSPCFFNWGLSRS